MGFRKDFKAGVKKLSWSSLKTKFSKRDKDVKNTSAETAVGVTNASATPPSRFVHASPSPSPSAPSRPTSRVPAGLTWATRRPAPLPAVPSTSELEPKSNSPQSILSSESGGEGRSKRAPSRTAANQKESNENTQSCKGHYGREAQASTQNSRSQLEVTVQELSERGSTFYDDDEGFFEPALPSGMGVAGRTQLSRPLEHHVWFKDIAIVGSPHGIQATREPLQPTTTIPLEARKSSLSDVPSLFVNHELVERTTKLARPAANPSPALSLSLVHSHVSSPGQTSSPPHSDVLAQPSLGSSSSNPDAPRSGTISANDHPANPQVIRPRTALKQLVRSRAAVVRENEHLVQELNILARQNEAGSQLVQTLLALNDGLNAQFNISQGDVAILTHELQQAQLQHAETLAALQGVINDLHMERAASAYLETTADELARQRILLQEQVQQQALDCSSLRTQIVHTTRQCESLQQEKAFAEEEASRWQRHCEEAEEERDTLEQEKASAEDDVTQWKEHCEEAEEHAEECMLKLNRLRGQLARSPRHRESKPAKTTPNHFEPPESDSEEELPTLEELCEERAYNDARFKSYQNHVRELEEQLAAAHERVQELGGYPDNAESVVEYDEDTCASSPRTLKDARQCIAHLREHADAAEKQRLALARWIEDLNKALSESENKRKVGLKFIELLQACEQKTNVCQHAQQAISSLCEKQQLRNQTAATHKKLKEEYDELQAYQDRTLCDLIYTDAENTDLKAQNKDLRADNTRLYNDNNTLASYLNNRVFGTDSQVAQQKLRQQRHRIWDLEQGIDIRNARIRELVSELKIYTARDKFGDGGVVQKLEEKVATVDINRLKYEAIVKAMEARFEQDLRREKLKVDLGPAKTEFTDDQEVQKRELRRLNPELYTLKDAEITMGEQEWWMM